MIEAVAYAAMYLLLSLAFAAFLVQRAQKRVPFPLREVSCREWAMIFGLGLLWPVTLLMLTLD